MNPASPRQRLLDALYRTGWFLVPFTLDTVSAKRKPVVQYKDIPQYSEGAFANLIRVNEGLDWAVRLPPGVAVIDIESVRHGGIDGFKVWADLGGLHLPEYVSVKTRHGGMHIYFRTTEQLRPCHLAKGVEVKGPGQTVHVPPSMGYEWGAGAPFCDADELPLMPADIEARARKAHNDRVDDVAASIPEGKRRSAMLTFLGRVRNCGANEAELAAIADAFRQRMDSPETFAPEEAAQIAKDIATKPVSQAGDIDSLAQLGDPVAQSTLAWWSHQAGYLKDVAYVDNKKPVVAAAPDGSGRTRWEPTLPSPGGVIEQWARWANSTNKVGQADLHMFAAIVAAGCMIGPRLHFMDAKANLYGVAVARSGLGKQRVRLSTLEVFKAMGLDHLKGAECGSGDGFMTEMRAISTRCFIWDEFGEKIEKMYGRNPSPYALELRTAMKEAYSGGDLSGKALKAGVSAAVLNPFAGVLGFVQPAVYQRTITRQNLEDGFIARFTVVKEDSNETLQVAEPCVVPQSLIDNLKASCDRFTLLNASPEAPVAVAVASAQVRDQANRIDCALFEAAKERGRKDESAATIMRRCREKFKKLALIHGVFSPERCVTLDSLEWAYAFTLATQAIALEFVGKAVVALDPVETTAATGETPIMLARRQALLNAVQAKDVSYRDLLAGRRHWNSPTPDEVIESLKAARKLYEYSGGPNGHGGQRRMFTINQPSKEETCP